MWGMIWTEMLHELWLFWILWRYAQCIFSSNKQVSCGSLAPIWNPLSKFYRFSLLCNNILFVIAMQVVVTNFNEGEVEELEAKIWPDSREGTYKVRFLIWSTISCHLSVSWNILATVLSTLGFRCTTTISLVWIVSQKKWVHYLQGSFVGESNVKCITILCLNAILKIHLFLVARFKPFCESIKNCAGWAGTFLKGLVHGVIRFSVERLQRLLWSCTRQECPTEVSTKSTYVMWNVLSLTYMCQQFHFLYCAVHQIFF